MTAPWALALILAQPEAARCEPSVKTLFSVESRSLQDHGINPRFIVAVRPAAEGRRLVVAEHRPGSDSALHIFGSTGAYSHSVSVPSPQLVDFALDAEGNYAYLVGSYGTRFYTADLARNQSRLVYASLPDDEGFRALTPVSIITTPKGPVVHGVFYQNTRTSLNLGFAEIWGQAGPRNLFPTASLQKRLKPSAFYPDPSLRSLLVVHRQPKPNAAKSGLRGSLRLSLMERGGKQRLLDSAEAFAGAAWAPDGKAVVYVAKNAEGGRLVHRSLDGQPRTLAKGQLFSPLFLSGGRRLAVGELHGSQSQTVRVINVDDPALQEELELPPGLWLYAKDPTGTALACWGAWGIRVFQIR